MCNVNPLCFFLRNAQTCRQKEHNILCVRAAENRLSSRNGLGRPRRVQRKGTEPSARNAAAYCCSVVIIIKMYTKSPSPGSRTHFFRAKEQYLVVFFGFKKYFHQYLDKTAACWYNDFCCVTHTSCVRFGHGQQDIVCRHSSETEKMRK